MPEQPTHPNGNAMTSVSKLIDQQTNRIQTAESIEADDNAGSTITVGLVPSPGFPEDIANDIRDDLATDLDKVIDSDVRWVVRVVPDPLSGSNVETPDLLDELGELAKKDEWDYTIALTDLPIRRNKQIVLADASTEERSGWISIPALGPLWPRRKVRRVTIQLMEDLYLGPDDDDAQEGDELIRLKKASRGDTSDAEGRIDTRYISQSKFAIVHLLGGMVYANKPWTIFPSFKTTAITAIATGSYGLIFSSMWELGEFSSTLRLILLSLMAMSLLGLWIIVSHGLWQPHRDTSSQFLTALYNTTTVITIGVGVLFSYAIIYLVLLFEAVVFMPPALITTRLEMPVDALNYITATWVTTNVATLAGALGAGLEDTERVRHATFSWRMQRRFEEHEAALEEDQVEREENP